MNNTTAITTQKDNELLIGVQEFQKRLNETPDTSKVRINEKAKNSKYIPIDEIENMLDSIYVGLWKTHSFTTNVIANEITGEIILEVFHPEAKTWISRVGAAGTLIKQQSGAGITDISKKYKNALVTDYPHLKAECVKNAAKSLGKSFGRSLNRSDNFDYETEYSDQNDLDMLEAKISEMSKETMKGESAVIMSIAKERLSSQDQTRIKLSIQDKINRLVKGNDV